MPTFSFLFISGLILKFTFSEEMQSLHLQHGMYVSGYLHADLWPYARKFKDGLWGQM